MDDFDIDYICRVYCDAVAFRLQYICYYMAFRLLCATGYVGGSDYDTDNSIFMGDCSLNHCYFQGACKSPEKLVFLLDFLEYHVRIHNAYKSG